MKPRQIILPFFNNRFFVALMVVMLFGLPVTMGQVTKIGLKDAYNKLFPIGAAIDPAIYLTDAKRKNFLLKQYSSLTAENQMKPRWIQPKENYFNWKAADSLVEFATKNGIKVRGHCLVWFARTPDWFFKDGFMPASKDLIAKRLEKHISTVVSRYKGKVYCWDVVNEAVTNTGVALFYPQDKFYKALGEDYIMKAFEWAHKADPKAQLYYNEYFYDVKKRDKVFQLLSRLKKRGTPINGIGIQCHLGIEGIDAVFLQETFDMFKSIGIAVQITELDVSIFNRDRSAKDLVGVKDEYTKDVISRQAKVFETIFSLARRNLPNFKGITLWSPADWPNNWNGFLRKRNYPYLFDNKLEPKEVFKKVMEF